MGKPKITEKQALIVFLLMAKNAESYRKIKKDAKKRRIFDNLADDMAKNTVKRILCKQPIFIFDENLRNKLAEVIRAFDANAGDLSDEKFIEVNLDFAKIVFAEFSRLIKPYYIMRSIRAVINLAEELNLPYREVVRRKNKEVIRRTMSENVFRKISHAFMKFSYSEKFVRGALMFELTISLLGKNEELYLEMVKEVDDMIPLALEKMTSPEHLKTVRGEIEKSIRNIYGPKKS